ncbi:uncharacterized protein METZ01_LOCUS89630, partial [marine metagenome]
QVLEKFKNSIYLKILNRELIKKKLL